MSNSPGTPVSASPPFDHVKADAILRSSDGVDFRVFKLFLTLASPVLESLFNHSQPSEETSIAAEIGDGLPVICVSEDSRTLDSLLRFCYPCTLAEDPSLKDSREVISILEAAKKYSLDAISRTVRKSLFIPKILEVNSLDCFAIACHYRMPEECILAAKYTLREPLVPGWFEEIKLVTSTELLSLLSYHRECGRAVQTLNRNLSWITVEYSRWSAVPWMVAMASSGYSCECPQSTSGRQLFEQPIARWWEDYMNSTFLDLQNKPCAETIRSNTEKAIQAVLQRNCSYCCPVAPGGMREFAVLLTKKVEDIISKVALDLAFLRDRRLPPGMAGALGGGSGRDDDSGGGGSGGGSSGGGSSGGGGGSGGDSGGGSSGGGGGGGGVSSGSREGGGGNSGVHFGGGKGKQKKKR